MRTPRSSRATTESSSSSSLILRHPAPASRSFVLASLRALHPDPVALVARACAYGDDARSRKVKPKKHLTRPAPSEMPLGALGSAIVYEGTS